MNWLNSSPIFNLLLRTEIRKNDIITLVLAYF
nr:MAG TPA: hypothetical protein [Caudoviricetes sp.]